MWTRSFLSRLIRRKSCHAFVPLIEGRPVSRNYARQLLTNAQAIHLCFVAHHWHRTTVETGHRLHHCVVRQPPNHVVGIRLNGRSGEDRRQREAAYRVERAAGVVGAQRSVRGWRCLPERLFALRFRLVSELLGLSK
jgi:hypothetical protein